MLKIQCKGLAGGTQRRIARFTFEVVYPSPRRWLSHRSFVDAIPLTFSDRWRDQNVFKRLHRGYEFSRRLHNSLGGVRETNIALETTRHL